MNKLLLNKNLILACLCLLVAGCASVDKAPNEPANDPVSDAFETDRRRSTQELPLPQQKSSSQRLPEAKKPLDLPKAKAHEQRLDISVFETDAREFFMGLVADSPYNIVVHPEVKGTISINLKNVTIPQVLEAVREVYGYEFKHTRVGYIVLPAELQTRIFHIDHLNLIRHGVSETRVTSGQISGGEDSDHSESGNSSNSRDSRRSSTSGSLIETQSIVDFWAELKSALQTIVGSDNGTTVVVNPQSGVLVVKAMPSRMREVQDFLAATQNQIQRQVILEAKILEVQLNDGFQSGINWAALIELGSNAITLGQTGGGTLLGNGISEIAGNAGNLNPNDFSAVNTNDTSAFGGAFTALFDFKNFKSLIELLETQGKVHTLSNPRISTLNNQKAVIKVGSDEYFVTDVSTTTVTGVTTQINPNITLTPFFSGIALDVTPQIDRDGTVTLHIHPSVTQVEDQQKIISVGGTNQSLPLAFSTVRESDSIVRAENGQIIVIGGLMQDMERNDRAGTPFLSRLPLIGGLFRHSRESSQKSELVILLKPIVIDRSHTWAGHLDETEQRFNVLQNGGT